MSSQLNNTPSSPHLISSLFSSKLTMNILLIAFGTRGDVQPVIALGKGLQAAGQRVRLVAGANFHAWIASHGLEVVETQVDIQAMMQSETGVAWVQARSPFDEIRQMRKLYESTGLEIARDILRAAEWADLIVGGFTSDNAAQAVAQQLGKRYITHALQPLHPTRLGEATNVPFKVHGESILNVWSTRFAEQMLFSVYEKPMNAFRAELGQPPHTRKSYYDALHAVPALFAFSPQVVPPPPDWPAHKRITGYWFLDEASGWQAPDDLQAFLQAGSAPLYIGFGSMSDSDGKATGEMIVQALRENKLRAVLAQGWAGLNINNNAQAEDVLVLKSAPHDWLFPRMAAVVHHGGAGTTAAAFRAGVPQFIVSHFGDQHYWGRRVYELGVGPKAVPRRRLNHANMRDGLRDLTQQDSFRRNAVALGEKIRAEDGVAEALSVMHDWQLI